MARQQQQQQQQQKYQNQDKGLESNKGLILHWDPLLKKNIILGAAWNLLRTKYIYLIRCFQLWTQCNVL